MRLRAALLGLPLAFLAQPAAATLPESVRAMIEAAFRDNDPAAIAAVIKLAKETHPEDAAEIDAMTQARLKRLQIAKEAQREGAGWLEFVHGALELGASRSTGNTDSFGAYGSAQLTQDSPHWLHALNVRADYLRSNQVTTTDRTTAAFQSNYKFDPNRYIYGLAQFERDPILGFWARYTLGTGIGFTVANKPKLKIDLTGGPAVRHTNFLNVVETTDATTGLPIEVPSDGPHEATTLAGRASMNIRWQISPTVTVTQDAAIFVERGDSNGTGDLGLETPLIGHLKARFSYSVQYEADPPAGTKSLDTISRATLLYNF